MRLEHEALGTGYDIVDTNVSCLITRFEVRSILDIFRFYLLFRRIRARSKHITGLIATVFLVENPRTCYTLSIWRDKEAILEFNTSVLDHIVAANWSIRRLRRVASGVLLWSAQFRLSAVSQHNLNWEGVDVEQLIVRYPVRVRGGNGD